MRAAVNMTGTLIPMILMVVREEVVMASVVVTFGDGNGDGGFGDDRRRWHGWIGGGDGGVLPKSRELVVSSGTKSSRVPQWLVRGMLPAQLCNL